MENFELFWNAYKYNKKNSLDWFYKKPMNSHYN